MQNGLILGLALFIVLLINSSINAQTTGSVQWQKITAPSANTHPNQTASQVFDVDGDGIKDIIIATRRSANAIAWYKKTGSTYTKYTIETGQVDIEAGGAHHDIDGDGDTDLVFANDASGSSIWWWENPTDPTKPWARHTIKNGGGTKHHDSMFGDVDGDGKAEFITWNQNGAGLIIAEIPANPKGGAWTFTTIAGITGDNEGLEIIDIDLDGKLDIVGAGRWFKHTSGTSFQTNNIDTSMGYTRAAAGQFIPGGRPEVIFVCGDCDGPMKMYSWNGSSWDGKVILDISKHGHSIGVGDINGDGKLDIFNGEMGLTDANPQTHILFGDGAGNFQKTQFAGQLHHESRLADLDGDGDLDIMAKPYKDTGSPEGPSVYLNQSNTGSTPAPTGKSCEITPSSWKTHTINTRSHTYVFTYSGDIDGDGKKDIITGDSWFKNPGTPNGTWQKRPLGNNLNNVAAVYDFDGNGKLDVLATDGGPGGGNPWGRTLAIGRNDGTGTFTPYTNIQQPTQGDFLQGVAVGKFTSDTIQVALSWHGENNNVQLYTFPSNLSGQATFQNIGTSQNEDLSAGDIDKDGKLDILQGTKWLKNNGTSWQQLTLHSSSEDPDRNKLADINKDGKLDAIIGYEAINIKGILAWYEQTTPMGTWTERIISNQVIGPMSMDTADMDGDGDIDVIVGEHYLDSPQSAKLFIFENLNNGASWTQHVIAQGQEHHDGAQTVDIDGDGDMDIMSIGWDNPNILLYENTTSCTGITPPPNSCPHKFKGDADCKSDPAGKSITILDYAIWYGEHIAECSDEKPAGCGTNADGIGSAMDANFNFPGTSYILTDTKIDTFDYSVWIQGFVSQN